MANTSERAAESLTLGIDASNLRAGGGVTHLREMLKAADPPAHGVRRVIVWSGRDTCAQLAARPWLDIAHDPALDGPVASRLAWQHLRLPEIARGRIDLLFAPGGTTSARVRPRVVMSRNMLPFDPDERARYGLSLVHARLVALRVLQARSFADAEGVIFLTEHAHQRIRAAMPRPPRRHAIIPHGVDARFHLEPKGPRALGERTASDPFRFTYVSTVSPYKHQDRVLEAVRALRAEGLPVRVDFIGAADPGRYAADFVAKVRALDPAGEFAVYHGRLGAEAIAAIYARTDVGVYASSCENMPNILLEAMSAGLPLACSDRGPMPEILADGGSYFDPEDARDLLRALRGLMTSPARREDLARRSAARARRFSWERCARETFDFLTSVARGERLNYTDGPATSDGASAV